MMNLIAGNQERNRHITNRIIMAQKHWRIHHSWSYKTCGTWVTMRSGKKNRLPGEGLDISWVTQATNRRITDWFYAWTASERKCTVTNCEYSTLSRHKLLDHIVTHCLIYATDCIYLMSWRDSAVKHLRTCHGRQGSITQADEGSLRLWKSNWNCRR